MNHETVNWNTCEHCGKRYAMKHSCKKGMRSKIMNNKKEFMGSAFDKAKRSVVKELYIPYNLRAKVSNKLDPKPRKQIRHMSKKLAKERVTYRQLREEFLSKPENMFCAVYPSIPSSEIHHMRGRGKYLNDTSTWLAVSRIGHIWLHENVALAIERGFMASRLSLVTPLNEE